MLTEILSMLQVVSGAASRTDRAPSVTSLVLTLVTTPSSPNPRLHICPRPTPSSSHPRSHIFVRIFTLVTKPSAPPSPSSASLSSSPHPRQHTFARIFILVTIPSSAPSPSFASLSLSPHPRPHLHPRQQPRAHPRSVWDG
jgi:hypothetical protein